MSALVDKMVDLTVMGATAGGGYAGLRWLLTWFTARYDRRQALLDTEHDALNMSWKDYRILLETRIASVERQNRALRMSFEHVAGALIRADPGNRALAIAEGIMAKAFPDEFGLGVARAEAAVNSTGGF